MLLYVPGWGTQGRSLHKVQPWKQRLLGPTTQEQQPLRTSDGRLEVSWKGLSPRSKAEDTPTGRTRVSVDGISASLFVRTENEGAETVSTATDCTKFPR